MTTLLLHKVVIRKGLIEAGKGPDDANDFLQVFEHRCLLEDPLINFDLTLSAPSLDIARAMPINLHRNIKGLITTFR